MSLDFFSSFRRSGVINNIPFQIEAPTVSGGRTGKQRSGRLGGGNKTTLVSPPPQEPLGSPSMVWYATPLQHIQSPGE
jgi:hypothetical protein